MPPHIKIRLRIKSATLCSAAQCHCHCGFSVMVYTWNLSLKTLSFSLLAYSVSLFVPISSFSTSTCLHCANMLILNQLAQATILSQLSCTCVLICGLCGGIANGHKKASPPVKWIGCKKKFSLFYLNVVHRAVLSWCMYFRIELYCNCVDLFESKIFCFVTLQCWRTICNQVGNCYTMPSCDLFSEQLLLVVIAFVVKYFILWENGLLKLTSQQVWLSFVTACSF